VLGCQLPNWNLTSDVLTYRHARYCIGDYAAAADAYHRGLELEPNNASMQAGLRNSEAHPADVVEDTAPPSAASAGGPGGLADTLRNLGGAGAGGMPDIGGMMNNPAMMQMAQQMMASGGLERLMSNPTVANMVSCIESPLCDCLADLVQMNQMNSGGGLPSMQDLMANPELRAL
jgi:small glutamine-rich tetratricopeptide repeat-containing protein alpha